MALIYTSGTTGTAQVRNAVMVRHREIMTDITQTSITDARHKGGVYCMPHPFHIADFPGNISRRVRSRCQFTIPKFNPRASVSPSSASALATQCWFRRSSILLLTQFPDAGK